MHQKYLYVPGWILLSWLYNFSVKLWQCLISWYKWNEKKGLGFFFLLFFLFLNLGHACITNPKNQTIFLEQPRETSSNADVLHSGITWQSNYSTHVTLLDWLSIALPALVYMKLQAVMYMKGLGVAYLNFMEILKTWKKFILWYYWSLLPLLPPQMFFSDDATCHHLT